MKLAALLLCALFAVTPLAKSLDGDMPDPFCNVQVATAIGYRGYKHAPKDIKSVQARLTRNRIKSDLAQITRGPDAKGRFSTEWFLFVYPADAAKARRLVEEAKRSGLHVEPDYTEPKPVGF